VRSLAVALLAFFTVACTGAPAGGTAAPVLSCDAQGDLCAVYTPGARSVRVLLVRPPSIVLMRERFVSAGEAIRQVQWRGATLVIETSRDRYALDTRTGTLVSAGPSQDMTASTRARRGS